MGTVENVEELLAIVAERVRERQRQNQQVQFQKNNNAVQVCKELCSKCFFFCCVLIYLEPDKFHCIYVA